MNLPQKKAYEQKRDYVNTDSPAHPLMLCWAIMATQQKKYILQWHTGRSDTGLFVETLKQMDKRPLAFLLFEDEEQQSRISNSSGRMHHSKVAKFYTSSVSKY